MKNIVNHFLIAFKPIKGFSLLATTDFILITVDGGSGSFNGDRQMHRILSGGGGKTLAERVVVPGVLEVAVVCYPGGGGDGGANEEFSVGGGEGSFNNGKKAK